MKLSHGDLFAIPLPDGTYLSGRIMLDLYGALKRRLLPADSPLIVYGKVYLIEMYSAVSKYPEHIPSPVLIKGALIAYGAVGNNWPLVGNIPVDPHTVEFPEGLVGFDHSYGQTAFCCGEMRIPVPLLQIARNSRVWYVSPSGGPELEVGVTSNPPLYWPYMCLWAMGRKNEIPAEWVGITFEHDDFRFTQYRSYIYQYLPFSMEMSYYEKQKQMGLHLERLYE